MESIEEIHRVVRDLKVYVRRWRSKPLSLMSNECLTTIGSVNIRQNSGFGGGLAGCNTFLFDPHKGERLGVAVELRATPFGLAAHRPSPVSPPASFRS
jgi:hypothetical protein